MRDSLAHLLMPAVRASVLNDLKRPCVCGYMANMTTLDESRYECVNPALSPDVQACGNFTEGRCVTVSLLKAPYHLQAIALASGQSHHGRTR